ncbi:hypothetical protein ACXET9_07065 [Brachybacterium sp. DNPG3]
MNALHPLGKLIQSVEDSRGWTLREIARRVDDRMGRTISHAYVARLKREPIKSISIETIRALSAGLDLPERDVAIAALGAMGVHDSTAGDPRAAVAIARDPELSDRDRRILLAVLREMDSGDDTQHDDPARPPRDGGPMDGDAQPDGLTVVRPLIHSIGERSAPPAAKEPWAAHEDEDGSKLDQLDAEAAVRGEESQDSGSDDPA